MNSTFCPHAPRTITLVRKILFVARAKPQPPQSPHPNTDFEVKFTVLDPDRIDHACRTPSPEAPASTSPAPSPGPPSSVSLPSFTLNSGQQWFQISCPQPRPLAFTSRRTLDDILNEVDLEFPPPRSLAPSALAGRSFIIDLSLSDTEIEDERRSATQFAPSNDERGLILNLLNLPLRNA